MLVHVQVCKLTADSVAGGGYFVMFYRQFGLFLHKKHICCKYSLEATLGVTDKEYQQGTSYDYIRRRDKLCIL